MDSNPNRLNILRTHQELPALLSSDIKLGTTVDMFLVILSAVYSSQHHQKKKQWNKTEYKIQMAWLKKSNSTLHK